MAVLNDKHVIAAILATSGAVPRAGQEYTISASEFDTTGTLKDIVFCPCHSNPGSDPAGGGGPRWSRIASVEFEVFRAAIGELMPGGRSRPITICDRETRAPVAAGLTVACKSAHAFEAGVAQAESRGLTIWLTGLSGAGKTTIANALERMLEQQCRVEVLDADSVRTHLCKGLGFTEEDRRENVWRLALAARTLADTGAVVLVSAISPYRTARDEARGMIGRFVEVYVNAPLSICESRDVKGLYKKARNGEIQRFTGIDDPYEPPLNPEIECRTDVESISESVAKVMAAIAREGMLGPQSTEPAFGGAAVYGS